MSSSSSSESSSLSDSEPPLAIVTRQNVAGNSSPGMIPPQQNNMFGGMRDEELSDAVPGSNGTLPTATLGYSGATAVNQQQQVPSRLSFKRSFSFSSVSGNKRRHGRSGSFSSTAGAGYSRSGKAPPFSVNQKLLQLKVNQYLGHDDPYLLQQLNYSRAARGRSHIRSQKHARINDVDLLAKSSNVFNGHLDQLKEGSQNDAHQDADATKRRIKESLMSSSIVQWMISKNPFKTELHDDIDQKMKASNEWSLYGKSFFIFSPQSRLRRLGLAIMKNHLLLALSAFLTLVNLVWFVLERSPQYAVFDWMKVMLPHYKYYNYGYLGLYALELVFRMLILGVFTGRHSFFRNNWNIFEFFILLTSLIFIYWLNLSILRIFIIFRFLEGFAMFNSLKAIYESIWGALPRLRGVFLFMVFVLYMFAVTGVDFFRRNLTKRCGIVQSDGTFQPAIPDQWCSTNDFGFSCPGVLTCEVGTPNPNFGVSSFDNIASSLLLTFQILSISGWSSYYYMVSNTELFVIAFIWMFSLILLVSFVVLNLVVVAIDSVFDVLRYYAALNRENKFKGKKLVLHRALWAIPSAVLMYAERVFFFRKPRKIHRKLSPILCFPRKILRILAQSLVWDLAVMFIIFSNVIVEVLFSYNVLNDRYKSMVNWIYSGVYIAEILLSMLALGPFKYFKNNFNKFDVLIVLINVILTVVTPPGSVFENIGTQLRLLRIFSILSRLSVFEKIMTQTFTSLLSLVNVVIFVVVTTYGFAVVGNQLFEEILSDRSEPNFSDITNSMLSLFKILTGDTWEVQMYIVMGQNENLVAKYLAVPYFLVFFILARYILMSMFTVVVLEAFSSADETTPGSGKALFLRKRWRQFKGKLPFQSRDRKQDEKREKVYYTTTVELMGKQPESAPRKLSEAMDDKRSSQRSMQEVSVFGNGTRGKKSAHHRRTSSVTSNTVSIFNNRNSIPPLQQSDSFLVKSTTERADELNSIVKETVEQQYRPKKDRIFCIPCTSPFRRKLNQLVDSGMFQNVMLGVILFAALSLMLEEAPSSTTTENSTTRTVILGLDTFFFASFLTEFVLKFLAKGVRLFIRDPLSLLDIPLIAELSASITFFFISSKSIADLRSYLRLIRAIRPLRLILKLPDLRIYLAAMRSGIKSFALVFSFAILILVAFALICTRLFTGDHLYCTDATVTNLTSCRGFYTNVMGIISPRSVRNRPANFDNLLRSLVTLLEVSSLSNWSSIIWPTLSSDFQGLLTKEFRIEISLIFVVFIVLMVFFALNLFVGVLISEIELQRNNQSDLTLRQKYWAHLKRQIMLLKPERRVMPPRLLCFRVTFYIVSSKVWNFLIGLMIFGTTIIFASQFATQPETYGYVLDGIVAFVMLVLLLECVLKIMSYGVRLYFSSLWHVLYSVILSGMLVAFAVCLIIYGVKYEPIRLSMKVASRLLLLIRIIKIAMIFQSVRFMLETLYSAIPSLFNTFLVLLLVFLSYALVGLQLFSQTKYQDFIGINMNFRSMHKGLITLIRVLTLENWNGLMYNVAIQEPECTSGVDCGNQYAAWIYFFSFFLLGAHVLLSLLLGIVLDFFSHSFSSIPRSIQEKSVKQFVQLWKKVDPKGKGRISLSKFVKLNAELVKHGNELGLDRSKRLDNDKFLLALIEFNNGVKFTREERAQFSIASRLSVLQYVKNALKMLCCCSCFNRSNKAVLLESGVENKKTSAKGIQFNLCLVVLCRNRLEPDDRTLQETKARAKFLAASVQQLAASKIQRYFKYHKQTESQADFRNLVNIIGAENKKKQLERSHAIVNQTRSSLESDDIFEVSVKNNDQDERTVDDFARAFFSNL
uniref:EF-hand domain-containing protein n=1 Tax=Percolomonas cosmopolitus TaxID=63605 RepID=A0A6U0LD41_9EUKA|mmetsp:Transcript_58/g.199  ORF Transcript_58/g.199 Transcript_58/m.199 type:complete len:1827 (+) Transcript_58:174-5654(+)|eukprot:CAMPEP_0117453526 /NCGR_PEP_ID=MMETSP0759-20121206/10272_1 /TAXON_ID=63605 /ORGANISM="Percolomonas cosmopolitus, Strain WS" /LENGTH=1826 /DNA_ID=CAMNT_0005246567 /DNA_START=207 /DNA_END=5687 /DNA_ORIENTATION=-